MQHKAVFFSVILAVALVFSARLYNIQIQNDEYAARAERNATQAEKLYASRGYIYDRNKELLVGNSPTYDLMVSPYLVKNLDTVKLAKLLNLTTDDVSNRLIKAKKYSDFRSSMFMKMLPKEMYAMINTELQKFAGFYSQKRILRNYPKGAAANVVGFIGEVNTEFINANEGYSSGDLAGKSGIDKSYEAVLKGKHGKRFYTVDHRNRRIGIWKNGKHDVLPKAGKDIISSIDLNLQIYGEQLMKGKRGSIVAIEPATGEILALVTSPNYNPNELVGRLRSRNYTTLYYDSINKPLFDRGILAEYPPGSPFKLLGALIGLQEGVISPRTALTCRHGWNFGSVTVSCHCKGGKLDLRKAISESCNSYFCSVYQRTIDKGTNSREGMQNWSNHVKSFGLGKYLGNDLPTGKKGLVPDVSFYDNFLGYTSWKGATSISNGIGQGELLATPIQLANMTAAIANQGYYYTPHIVKHIEGSKLDSAFTIPKYTTIESKHFETVIDGMLDVFETGTARSMKLENITQCGKTGTAQNPHGQDHSIFVSFAPKKNPEIAIAVVIENGYWGSRWAAPISSLMTELYLTDTITRKNVEERMLNGHLHDEYRAQHQRVYGEDSTYLANF
ncbi:MAG: penicillin-binding protein 2 [Bacteroidota bacterium]|nr:penicillin-binding protein 2 [Bacteroidota bacterium]